MGSNTSERAIQRLLEARGLGYLATAAEATVGTAALVEFELEGVDGTIPDRDVWLQHVELHFANLGAGVTSVTWGLFRATGQVGPLMDPIQSAIRTFPAGTKVNGVTGFLAGLPFVKIAGLGTSGSIFLTIQAAGADTVDITPWLTYTAALDNPAGIFLGSVA